MTGIIINSLELTVLFRKQFLYAIFFSFSCYHILRFRIIINRMNPLSAHVCACSCFSVGKFGHRIEPAVRVILQLIQINR